MWGNQTLDMVILPFDAPICCGSNTTFFFVAMILVGLLARLAVAGYFRGPRMRDIRAV